MRTLQEYLHGLRACEDDERLLNEFKIYDNWPITFYGDKDKLFSEIMGALKSSPQNEGIQDAWHCFREYDGYARFYYDLGTVEAQVKKGVNYPYSSEEDEANVINGVDHSVWIMFHPYQQKKMDNTSSARAMALAIAGIGEYVIRANLTVRLPRGRLNLNHIPHIPSAPLRS